ncbi:hypothetical protein [Mesorhizobium sp. CAU 1741]|uniref:hypothetical protein n=1 Tax=Mesorhizobium sp. CAU 1741 TaxID=3140366 RepID=UPI00325A4F08
MERDQPNTAIEPRDDAIVEALLAPGEGSFVDALLTLADESARHDGPADARHALSGGFQAALARRMREVIAKDDASRDAA